MPNANIPSGLNPVRYLSGAPYNGAVNQYSVAAGDSTALFLGDPVKLVGTSQIINGQVFADVTRAATGDVILGALVSVIPTDRDSLLYRAASTQRVVAIADDPNLEFEIQDISTGTPLTVADIGLNVNFVVNAGNAFSGLSGVTLNNASEATTNTLDLKIAGFVNRPDNDSADAEPSKKFIVRINRHQYVNQLAGV